MFDMLETRWKHTVCMLEPKRVQRAQLLVFVLLLTGTQGGNPASRLERGRLGPRRRVEDDRLAPDV